MSCPNFSYQHRCLLVTNDDWECGNHPAVGEWNDGDRNYPSVALKKWEDNFYFVKVVMTAGNYSDSCIDYIRVKKNIYDVMGDPWYYRNYNRKELIGDLRYYFPEFSKNFFNKLLKGCNMLRDDYQDKLYEAFDAIEEKMVEWELAEANKIVDKIKANYGYTELVCGGIFSNGEAIYYDKDTLRGKLHS